MSDRPQAIVLEFARAPVPGRTKTRLARTEGHNEAARIYVRLAQHVHQVLRAAQDDGQIELALCLPPGDAPWLEGAAHVWSQGAGDLGARLARCATRAFEAGADRVLAVGTDVIGLDDALLARALARLDAADVVLAPTPDGGYGLIGLRRPTPEVFEDIPWSTAAVTSATRARARAAGLEVRELGGLRDVDVAADLDGAIPRLSILVPVLDDAARLARLLPELAVQAAAEFGDVEVLVIDGGSADDSRDVARAAGVRCLRSAPGRGVQLAQGAREAAGRWLWTLHADTELEPGAVAAALRFCRRDRHVWGFCATRIAHPSTLLRVINTFATYRATMMRLPYGDQGILAKRAVFDHVGGYTEVPLMEDVLLAARLRAYGPPGRIATRLVVDARRWRHHGVLRTTWLNWHTLGRFLFLGTTPGALAKAYTRGG